MTLNKIGEIIINQAKEKGWGYTKEGLVVSEKMILICTEIMEMRKALKKNNVDQTTLVGLECADILLRTLHLGMAWGVNFDKKTIFTSHFADRNSNQSVTDTDFVYLYALVSRGYEAYRHKKIRLFKKYLYRIAHEAVEISRYLKADIEKSALTKIEINKSRTWSAKRLNGGYVA